MRPSRSGGGLQRFLHELGRLVVQAVGDMEIRLGNRIGLIEIDDGLARESLIRRHRLLRTRRGGTSCRGLPLALCRHATGTQLLRVLLLDDDRLFRHVMTQALHRVASVRFFFVGLRLERFPAAFVTSCSESWRRRRTNQSALKSTTAKPALTQHQR